MSQTEPGLWLVNGRESRATMLADLCRRAELPIEQSDCGTSLNCAECTPTMDSFAVAPPTAATSGDDDRDTQREPRP